MFQRNLLQPGIYAKLRSLRAAVRGRLLVEAGAWVVLALVALVFITLAFDYLMDLNKPLRALILVSCLGALGWIIWEFLIRPMRVQMDTKNLALLVEGRYKHLGDRLVSAIEFSQQGDLQRMGISEAMVDRVGQEANNLAGQVPFTDVVSYRGVTPKWVGAGSALLVLLSFSVWQSDLMGLWFRRNIMFSDDRWPQSTYLQVRDNDGVDDGNFQVLLGRDLEVEVVLDEKSTYIPPYITVHAEYPSYGSTEERVELVSSTEDKNYPHYKVTFENVTEEFSFYVTGGDDELDAEKPHQVSIIPPPSLQQLRFRVLYPRYTGQKPDEVGEGEGVLTVPVGGVVEIEALATKDLLSAAIEVGQPDLENGGEAEALFSVPLQVETVGMNGQDRPRRVVGRFEVTDQNISASRIISFALVDRQGYPNLRPQRYNLQIVRDPSPIVDLQKQGVGQMVTTRANIPFSLVVKDEQYGVAGTVLTAAVEKNNLEPVGEWVTPPLGSRPPTEYAPDMKLDLQPLKLTVGQNLRVQARARDTLPGEFGGPNEAVSSVITFRVVTDEELMSQLIQRQRDLTLEFVHVIELQVTARGKTLEAASRLAAGKDIAEARPKVQESVGTENSVSTELAKTYDNYASILDEMRNNQLGEASDHNRMAEIITRLGQLQDRVRKVSVDLQKTGNVTDADDLRAELLRIAAEQEKISTEDMNAILEMMVKNQTLQGIINKGGKLHEQWARLMEMLKNRATGGLGLEDEFEEPSDEEDSENP